MTPLPVPKESARSLDFPGFRLEYRLCRAVRRTIGISVDQRGVRVSAPVCATLGEIEELLRAHGGWVRQKLLEWQRCPVPEAVREGSVIPWLGRPLLLKRAGEGRRSRWRIEEGALELAVPAGRSFAEALTAALKPRARAVFLDRLTHYAALLGVPAPMLRLSSARSRWGSCNTKGEIRLSWRLAHFSEDLVDYVVAHELAHLKEMNHSPRFWAVVAQLYPDWRKARAALKAEARRLPEL